MTALNDPVAEPAQRTLVMTRFFDAPRDLLFQVWTRPEHLARWWGPHGFTAPVCESDPRDGGAILIHMRAPDGSVNRCRGFFGEVVEPERIVFTLKAFEDAEGNPTHEVLNVITLAEQEGGTFMTLHVTVVETTPELDAVIAAGGMEEGWRQSLERFADLLKSMRSVEGGIKS